MKKLLLRFYQKKKKKPQTKETLGFLFNIRSSLGNQWGTGSWTPTLIPKSMDAQVPYIKGHKCAYNLYTYIL